MFLKATILIGNTCLFFMMVYTCQGQPSSLRIHEAYGTFSVGFQSINTFDYSRSFAKKNSMDLADAKEFSFRPIQVCIWYPALNKKGIKPMHYEDYFFLSASETGYVALTTSKKEEVLEDFLNTEPVNSTNLKKELGAEMLAVKNATPDVSQKFPIIIYGPSWDSTAFENALLCEYLASHGYIIISSPSVGPDKRDMPISRIGIETQARDMEFLLQEISKFPNADLEKIAVAGYSLGGLSSVIMLARNGLVDAWIGIDPSIHEAYDIFKESPYEDYSRFTKPTLFINSSGYMNYMPFFDRLVYSDAFVVDLPKLGHTDMASQFIKLFGSNDSKENLENRTRGYNALAKYLLGFVDGVFKERLNYQGMADGVFYSGNLDSTFIQIHSKQGILLPDQLVKKFKSQKGSGIVEYLEASIGSKEKKVYPEADLQKLIFHCIQHDFDEATYSLMKWYRLHYPGSFHKQVLERIDFKKMIQMFEKLYESNNACHFTYGELNHTAQILSMGGREEEAMDYFILNTKLYPNNHQAFFNLGIGYYRLKNMSKARENFEKCLELKPDERFRNLAMDYLVKTQK